MGELAALSASAVWAAASLMFARLSSDHGPLVMNFLKCAIAGVFLMLTLLALEGSAWPAEMTTTNIAFLAASGIVGLTIGDTAFFNALTRIGARRSLLLMALSPPTTALLAVPFLDEPITPRLALGMVLTLGGVVWVILERTTPPEELETTEESRANDRKTLTLGVVFGLVAMFCQSAGNILTKLGGDLDSPLAISVVRLAFGIIGLFLVVGVTGRLAASLEPFKSRKTAALLVVATILGTYLGIWLLNAGLKYSLAGIAATLSSTSPIFVLPLAYFIQKEKLSFRSIAGAFIAVSGVAVIFLLPIVFPAATAS